MSDSALGGMERPSLERATVRNVANPQMPHLIDANRNAIAQLEDNLSVLTTRLESVRVSTPRPGADEPTHARPPMSDLGGSIAAATDRILAMNAHVSVLLDELDV